MASPSSKNFILKQNFQQRLDFLLQSLEQSLLIKDKVTDICCEIMKSLTLHQSFLNALTVKNLKSRINSVKVSKLALQYNMIFANLLSQIDAIYDKAHCGNTLRINQLIESYSSKRKDLNNNLATCSPKTRRKRETLSLIYKVGENSLKNSLNEL